MIKTKPHILLLILILFSNGIISSSIKANGLNYKKDPGNSVEFPNSSNEQAQFYYKEGVSLHDSGEYLSAETLFLKAIELSESPGDNEIIAFSLHYLGNIESWKSNFSRSITYHKEAIALFEELSNSEYTAISNNRIASGFTSLAEYDSTLVYFLKNIENKNAIDAKYTVFDSYRSIAVLYASLNNYKQAYTYLQEGIEYAEETGSKMSLAKLYLTAGLLFLNNDLNKDIALEYLLQSQSLFAELNDSNYLNWAKLSIGDAHFKAGNDTLAMQLYVEVSENVSQSNYSIISRVDHKIGMVYKSRNENDSALIFLQKSIDGMCLVCPEIQIHTTLIEAGRLYLDLDNSPKAFQYFDRARSISVESNSGLEIVISYEELANYYQTFYKNDSALYYFNNAYDLAKDLGLLKRIKTSAESISEIYYSSGEFQASADYLKISKQMIDSLAGIEKYKEIATLEMRFEIERREEEGKLATQLLKSEITKQKLIRNTSVAGAILFIIIGFVILLAYRSKRKDNRLLSIQKAEIQVISKQLQESDKRKLNFFTNISHEIRTPLTLIKSPLERILKTDENNHEIDSQIQIALKNTNKLKELLNQVLDLQKLDENLLGLDLSEFDLIDFCREIVSSFEGYSYQSQCKLIFESNISEAIIKFDKIRLQSIINNLLSNAFKYNKQGGLVQFQLEVNNSQINLEIKDSGIGISNENLKRLGERYYQIENPNASVEGTGIGLAYVKELVKLMDGSIEISSVETKGTSVAISLPCDLISTQTEQPVSMVIKPREQLFDDLEEQINVHVKGLPQILIIEDNFELRLFLRDLFAPFYQVICAKDGQEGKEMALKFLPDLILSDIMMPGIKGNELCKILKNDINTSHITIILFTAKSTPDSIVDGYDCGADDYIVKPFETEILLKKVKNIIATGENARKQFSFTDIERTSTVYSEFDKKFLKDCMSVIKDNIDKTNFTVEVLAENLNVHRRTLLRKFNTLTGKSPIELIRHSRMSKAAELLRDEKYRVNEVALMVGYEDSSRFSQAFKQFHGVSPSSYK